MQLIMLISNTSLSVFFREGSGSSSLSVLVYCPCSHMELIYKQILLEDLFHLLVSDDWGDMICYFLFWNVASHS